MDDFGWDPARIHWIGSCPRPNIEQQQQNDSLERSSSGTNDSSGLKTSHKDDPRTMPVHSKMVPQIYGNDQLPSVTSMSRACWHPCSYGPQRCLVERPKHPAALLRKQSLGHRTTVLSMKLTAIVTATESRGRMVAGFKRLCRRTCPIPSWFRLEQPPTSEISHKSPKNIIKQHEMLCSCVNPIAFMEPGRTGQFSPFGASLLLAGEVTGLCKLQWAVALGKRARANIKVTLSTRTLTQLPNIIPTHIPAARLEKRTKTSHQR